MTETGRAKDAERNRNPNTERDPQRETQTLREPRRDGSPNGLGLLESSRWPGKNWHPGGRGPGRPPSSPAVLPGQLRRFPPGGEHRSGRRRHMGTELPSRASPASLAYAAPPPPAPPKPVRPAPWSVGSVAPSTPSAPRCCGVKGSAFEGRRERATA